MKIINKLFYLTGYLVLFNVTLNAHGSLELKLFNAIENNNVFEVSNLLVNGVDVNAESNRFNLGGTALLFALNDTIIRLLISNGADVNAKNRLGQTALMFASSWGKRSAMKILISNSVDINAKSNYGETALIIALENKKLEAARLLIENGADISVKNSLGNSAVILAPEHHYHDIKQLLESIKAIDKDKASFEDQPSRIKESLALRWLSQGKFTKLIEIKNYFFKNIAKVYIYLKSGVDTEIINLLYSRHDLSRYLKSKEAMLPWINKSMQPRNKEKEAYMKLISRIKQIRTLALKLGVGVASKIVLEY